MTSAEWEERLKQRKCDMLQLWETFLSYFMKINTISFIERHKSKAFVYKWSICLDSMYFSYSIKTGLVASMGEGVGIKICIKRGVKQFTVIKIKDIYMQLYFSRQGHRLHWKVLSVYCSLGGTSGVINCQEVCRIWKKTRSIYLFWNERLHFVLSVNMPHNACLTHLTCVKHTVVLRLSVLFKSYSDGRQHLSWEFVHVSKRFLQGKLSCPTIKCFSYMNRSSPEENNLCVPSISFLWNNGQNCGGASILGVSGSDMMWYVEETRAGFAGQNKRMSHSLAITQPWKK